MTFKYHAGKSALSHLESSARSSVAVAIFEVLATWSQEVLDNHANYKFDDFIFKWLSSFACEVTTHGRSRWVERESAPNWIFSAYLVIRCVIRSQISPGELSSNSATQIKLVLVKATGTYLVTTANMWNSTGDASHTWYNKLNWTELLLQMTNCACKQLLNHSPLTQVQFGRFSTGNDAERSRNKGPFWYF